MLFNVLMGKKMPNAVVPAGLPVAGPRPRRDAGLLNHRVEWNYSRAALCPPPDRHSHRVVIVLGAVLLLLPALLSAGHPVAVYGFLANRYVGALWTESDDYSRKDIEGFLVSERQVERYRRELLDDMLDTWGGSLFAITRTAGGAYRQQRVRTWNSFLPAWLAEGLGDWLDYKEVPYLGDEVKIWLGGDTIIAMGHYHPFGGGPSKGDTLARRFSMTSEVVVSNGLIPFVYLDGKLVGYGGGGELSKEVFLSMRAMEKCLTMAPTEVPISVSKPSAAIEAFVEYLSADRHVDTSDKTSVAMAVEGLCNEFRSDYAEVFNEGYQPSSYGENLDKAYMLWNLSNTELWAFSVRAKVLLARRSLGSAAKP